MDKLYSVYWQKTRDDHNWHIEEDGINPPPCFPWVKVAEHLDIEKAKQFTIEHDGESFPKFNVINAKMYQIEYDKGLSLYDLIAALVSHYKNLRGHIFIQYEETRGVIHTENGIDYDLFNFNIMPRNPFNEKILKWEVLDCKMRCFAEDSSFADFVMFLKKQA